MFSWAAVHHLTGVIEKKKKGRARDILRCPGILCNAILLD